MNIFQSFPVRKPKGNLFNLSHERKFSFNMGELIPCYVQDVVPGDRFRVSSEVFLRFAPMLAPVMHRTNVYVHFFFVPNRLVWPSDAHPATDGWELYVTGGPDGTSEPTFPTLQITDANKSYFVAGRLPDYMGLPQTDGVTVSQNLTFSALPFRAYHMIYNEYYRDPNLTTEVNFMSTNYIIQTAMRHRCWEKDYFTSALPWSQRGGDVNLPVEAVIDFIPDYKDTSEVKQVGGGSASGNLSATAGLLQDGTGNSRIENLEASTEYEIEDVQITINDLRQSVRLQQWLERNARGGGRYIEQILSHFGVRSSDARLQRPEYLGGGKSPCVMSEVLTTADSGSYDGAEMLGHGISVGRTNTFNKFFEEHGYVIGIISVLPRTCYQQGVPKHLLKVNDKYELFFPEFANLGEQEVLNGEVYWDWTNTAAYDDTFGYQSRYAEYKYMPSSVHGDFKDDLDYWHQGRIFSSAPSLNTSFVEVDETADEIHRIHIVTSSSYDKMYCQIYNNVKAWRPMPKYGIPIL